MLGGGLVEAAWRSGVWTPTVTERTGQSDATEICLEQRHRKAIRPTWERDETIGDGVGDGKRTVGRSSQEEDSEVEEMRSSRPRKEGRPYPGLAQLNGAREPSSAHVPSCTTRAGTAAEVTLTTLTNTPGVHKDTPLHALTPANSINSIRQKMHHFAQPACIQRYHYLVSYFYI
ncbi:predicted protein [Histoplasma capsulatum var. duboisii H88]|uniref:Predicted protein n=1 Tax=Ajellomyces capsulatus (strain H88) TaxID=544711 RepID=F0U5V2_AJEC8|nr:predicted protein [Histoplasma capsulatum var. duboisii H88]